MHMKRGLASVLVELSVLYVVAQCYATGHLTSWFVAFIF